jgi:predicted nuclease of predicted toxin-antitoxin system
MRFHLDEHVPSALATALRLRGYDVTTAADSGLIAADDESHVDHAVRENRVIVTHDRDYLSLRVRGAAHGGILYCHQQKYSVGQLLMMCLLVSECYSDEEMHGRVEFL